MFGMSVNSHDLTDSVLECLVRDRRDHKFTADFIIDAYRRTFSNTGLEPLDADAAVRRVFIESLMWACHENAVNAGDYPGDRTREEFVEGWRMATFNHVRAEAFEVEAAERELNIPDHFDPKDYNNG